MSRKEWERPFIWVFFREEGSGIFQGDHTHNWANAIETVVKDKQINKGMGEAGWLNRERHYHQT